MRYILVNKENRTEFYSGNKVEIFFRSLICKIKNYQYTIIDD